MRTEPFKPGQVVGIHFADHHVRKAIVYAVVNYATHHEYAVIFLDDNSRMNVTSNFVREWQDMPVGLSNKKKEEVTEIPAPQESPTPQQNTTPIMVADVVSAPVVDAEELVDTTPVRKPKQEPDPEHLLSKPVQDIPDLENNFEDEIPY